MKLKNTNPKIQVQTPFKIGFKESVFLLGILGWGSLGMLLGNLLKEDKRSNQLVYILSSISILFSIIFVYSGINLPLLQLIFVLSIFVFFVSLDCDQNKFLENITIHLCNSVFLGLTYYFVAMQLQPESFRLPSIWTQILPSVPTAINMLTLCMVFQNFGYYIVWGFLKDLIGFDNFNRWFVSTKNLVNLSFIRNTKHQNILFFSFITLGLVFRLSNIVSGRFFYIGASNEGEGVDYNISSFLAQFEVLYKIAWSYGLTLLFSRSKETNLDLEDSYNPQNPLIIRFTLFFVFLEFIYQFISGSKGRFFSVVIIPIATIFFFTHRRIKWKVIGAFTSVLMVSWLMLYPTLVIYRDVITSTAIRGDVTAQSLLVKSWETLQDYSWDEYQNVIFTPLTGAGNAEAVTAMISIVHYQDQVKQDGSLLWQRLLFFWVPRFLWTDKPEILSTNLIGRLSGRLTEGNTGTSVLTTQPGELFLYYGLFGSVFMILPGVIIRWFNEAISPFKIFTPFRVAVYLSYLNGIINAVSGGGFEASVTGTCLQLFTLYAALFVVRKIV